MSAGDAVPTPRANVRSDRRLAELPMDESDRVRYVRSGVDS